MCLVTGGWFAVGLQCCVWILSSRPSCWLIWFGLIRCLFMFFGPNGKVGCADRQLSDAHLQANFSDVMTRTRRTRCARCSVGKCRRVSNQRVLFRFKSRERCLVLSFPPQPCSQPSQASLPCRVVVVRPASSHPARKKRSTCKANDPKDARLWRERSPYR
jgi:hypothetical protein